MKAMDYNGHTPDGEAFAHSADWHAGYDQAVVDLAYRLLEQIGVDLLRARIEAEKVAA